MDVEFIILGIDLSDGVKTTSAIHKISNICFIEQEMISGYYFRIIKKEL